MVPRVLRLLLGLVSVVYLVERLGLWSWRLGQNILRWLLHVATWCWVNTEALLRMWVQDLMWLALTMLLLCHLEPLFKCLNDVVRALLLVNKLFIQDLID